MQTFVVSIYFLALIQPLHFLPWPSALNNGIACAAGLFLILNAFRENRKPVKFDNISVFLLTFVVAHFFVHSDFFIPNWSLEYLLILFLGFVIYKFTGQNNDHLLILFPIAGAAIITAFLAIGGLFGLFHLSADWNLPASATVRWQGFLMQANNTGTLLVLGCLAVVFQVTKFWENSGSWVFRNLFLAFGCVSVSLIGLAGVLVQSRTLMLNYLIVLLVGLLSWRKLRGISLILLMLGSSAYLMGQWLLPEMSRLTTSVSSDPVGFGGRGLSSNLRLEIWSDLLAALWQQPWLGYGVGGTVKAFLAIESPSVVYGTYFSHAHNIVLELLLWFGIPLGSLLIFVFGRSLWRIARNVNEQTLLPSMMLMVLLVHAMLELPLHYAYFLIPMAIIWGWLSGQLPEKYQAKPVFSVPIRWFSSVALVVLVPLFYVVSVTYLHHEESLRQAKLEMAIKGWAAPAEPPPYPVLWELQALNEFVRADNKGSYPPEKINEFHELVSVYPAKTMIAKAIELFEANNRMDLVDYWKNKGCAIYGSQEFCHL